MNRGLLAIALLLLTTALAALTTLASCGSTSWEQSVRDANEANQPLVVEFYASWCKPCKWFEANVLPLPEVKGEMGQVTFRRLDYDSRAGRAHANRLGVRGVPTFVAVDESGAVIGGLQGAAGAKRFLSFLRWVKEQKRARSGLSRN